MAKPQSQKTDTMPVDTLVYFRRVFWGGKEGGGKKPCGTAAILLLRLLLISRSLKSRTFFLELSCVFAAASLVTSDSKHNFQRWADAKSHSGSHFVVSNAARGRGESYKIALCCRVSLETTLKLVLRRFLNLENHVSSFF